VTTLTALGQPMTFVMRNEDHGRTQSPSKLFWFKYASHGCLSDAQTC
jgi:hypothetical protein